MDMGLTVFLRLAGISVNKWLGDLTLQGDVQRILDRETEKYPGNQRKAKANELMQLRPESIIKEAIQFRKDYELMEKRKANLNVMIGLLLLLVPITLLMAIGNWEAISAIFTGTARP